MNAFLQMQGDLALTPSFFLIHFVHLAVGKNGQNKDLGKQHSVKWHADAGNGTKRRFTE